MIKIIFHDQIGLNPITDDCLLARVELAAKAQASLGTKQIELIAEPFMDLDFNEYYTHVLTPIINVTIGEEATPTPTPTPTPAPTPSWQFGGDNPPQDGLAQGQNGWRFMYTDEFNKKGPLATNKLNVSLIQDCVWDNNSLWWPPDRWIPPEWVNVFDYARWLQLPDGTNNPGAPSGYAEKTPVIAWTAPENGDYTFNFTYDAGGMGSEWEGVWYPATGDGVTVTINTLLGKIYQHTTATGMVQAYDILTGLPIGDPYQGALWEEDITVTTKVTLSAGERIYFATDPNADSDYDQSKFNIVVTKDPVDWGRYVFVPGHEWIMNLENPTTVNQFLVNLTLPAGTTARIKNKTGTVVTGTAKIGTGYYVEILVDGAVEATYQTVIRGDVSCDGNISGTDVLMLNRYLSGTVTLTPIQIFAANITASPGNPDYIINGTDALKINRFLAGLTTVSQEPVITTFLT